MWALLMHQRHDEQSLWVVENTLDDNMWRILGIFSTEDKARSFRFKVEREVDFKVVLAIHQFFVDQPAREDIP